MLEINLISAQGLKPPSSAKLRRLQTYALAWVHPSNKLRTRVDRVGAENPTWNDKFLFRVTNEFVSSDTSAVSVEIYALGYLKDPLIGTVRLLLSNCLSISLSSAENRTPAFTAVQIRRPSGSFHGVLNIGAMLIDGSDFAALTGISAIGYRDLMGKTRRRRAENRRRSQSGKGEKDPVGEYCENSCGDSAEFSDGTDSTTSSSSTASTVLKELNGSRDLAGRKVPKSEGGGILCAMRFQRKIHLSPSDQNLQVSFAREDLKKMR